MRYSLFMAALLSISFTANANSYDSVWTMQACIQYALQNNISIKQKILDERLASLVLQQSNLSQLPNINAGTGVGRSFGRSVDPTTNQYVDGQYDYLNLSGNADVLLFGWFELRNKIKANNYEKLASEYDKRQKQDDVILSVTTAFLRASLATEQLSIASKQLHIIQTKYANARKQYEIGKVPEFELLQIASQLANDSIAAIGAKTLRNNAILDLKAILNIEFTVPFNIDIVKDSLIEKLNVQSPEDLYQLAVIRNNGIKVSDNKERAAILNYKSAQAALYPKVTLAGQIGTNWSSNIKDLTGFTVTGIKPTGAFTYVDGQPNSVYQYDGSYQTSNVPLKNQLDNNFRQIISLNVNIPLFNSWRNRSMMYQAYNNIEKLRNQKQESEQTLKLTIYKICNEIKDLTDKYKTAETAVASSLKAFSQIDKRYNLGMSSFQDYITAKQFLNNCENGKLKIKYELILKTAEMQFYTSF